MPRQTVCILWQSLGYLVILNPPTFLLHTLSQNSDAWRSTMCTTTIRTDIIVVSLPTADLYLKALYKVYDTKITD